ncbi:Ptm1p NDAI_0K01790 [Naumovozyma dairenensis CBS 421]|uniref:Membrane protein PTM1 n=1 Tax=Naumovozyma dairenensis (strain ATCC 10597 / BCRC 20456 / CBS 421 / NBRC 0211 / NRRL Y-12639) TaxID=1071378 RepID=G0WHV9_NAUDC|nr:hypothetical protein NDAI_0K01790 [Naumovozyma dairenensis CBS 421]CCD27370.1 hypothetical protein NDAI_0K01790 [Naumovozyma dairenensis CBS 421]
MRSFLSLNRSIYDRGKVSRSMTILFCTFFFFLNTVTANKEKINQKEYEVCSGMYSKEDYGGKVDPFISFNLKKLNSKNSDDESDPSVTVAIFDFQDYLHLGVDLPDGKKYYTCDDYTIDLGLCAEEDRDQFIVQDVVYDPYTKTNKSLSNPVMSFSQDALGLHDTKYPVKKTGYYCVTVLTNSADTRFDATINFRNAYGNLAGSEINKLPLYGLLAIAYAIAMALYSFSVWKHKHELLPLHKYLLAFFLFLTAETIAVWTYYDIKNEKGDSAGAKVYMVFLSILTAGKVTFSFFLLLVTALGYGIVYPKLNKKLMRRCQFYALFTYCWCIAFLIQSYLADTEDPSPLILITFIPMGICLLGFYFMVLRSMTKTVAYLKDQRQVVKLNMYKKLLLIIYASFVFMLAGCVLTSFIFIGMNSIDMIEKNWRSRFFMTDFWPTLVYFAVFVIIAFIWRPTDTSYMLAVSQQLPTDPENVADFDLSDMQSLAEPFEDDNISIITDEEQGHGFVNTNEASQQQQAQPDNTTTAAKQAPTDIPDGDLDFNFSDDDATTPKADNKKDSGFSAL